MKKSVIAIQSFVITTIVYVPLVPLFFEMDNYAFGEENSLLMMVMVRQHIVNN